MIEGLSGISGEITKLALDVALERHKLIASNIANHKTVGYTQKTLKFEEYFANSLQDNKFNSENITKEQIATIRKSVLGSNASLISSNNAVDLQQEMVNLAKNTTHYQALLEGLAKKGSMTKMVIKGGNG